MTWSYSGDPSTSSKDAVRLLIEDTDPTAALFQDEEINWTITQESGSNPNLYMAGAMLCERVYNRRVDKAIGSARLSAGQYKDHYRELAQRLRMRALRRLTPYIGGISVSDKAAVEDNTDRVPPDFTKEMLDPPGQSWTPTSRDALLGLA